MRMEELNDISYLIRGGIFEVHKVLGPGLLESIYVQALVKELNDSGLDVVTEKAIPVYYKGEKLALGFRLDILVEDRIIVEVKSVERLMDVHKKQTLTYLKLTGKRLGILVNFNDTHIKDKESLIRIIN